MAASFRGNDLSYHKELRNHQNVRTDSDSKRGFFEIVLQLGHGRTEIAREVIVAGDGHAADGICFQSDGSALAKPNRLAAKGGSAARAGWN